MELKPQEVDLILKIRTRFQFGKIVVECKDSLPFRIEKTVEYDKLSSSFDLH